MIGSWEHATSRKLLLPVTCVHAHTHTCLSSCMPCGWYAYRIVYHAIIFSSYVATCIKLCRARRHSFPLQLKRGLPACAYKNAGRGRCMRWWTEKARLEKYGSGFGATHHPIEADTALGGQRGLIIYGSKHAWWVGSFQEDSYTRRWGLRGSSAPIVSMINSIVYGLRCHVMSPTQVHACTDIYIYTLCAIT